MREVADFFSTRAAAIICRKSSGPPQLLCFGAVDNDSSDEWLRESLQPELSEVEPSGLTNTLFSASMSDSDGVIYSIILDDTGPSFDQARRQSAEVLLPHLVRAINLDKSVGVFVSQTHEAVDDLCKSMVPAKIRLDSDGRVVRISAKARALIQSCSTISEVDDRIEFADAVVARHFDEGFGSIQNDNSGDPFFMSLDGGGRCGKLTLLVIPNEDGSAGAVLYLRSMSVADEVALAGFRERFGLTPKEIRLTTGLMSGKDLRQLSATFHVSTHTLRTQLKSVLRKTGASSQTALIILMLSEPVANIV